MKKNLFFLVIFLAGAMFFSSVATADEEVIIRWDHSIDLPYLDPDNGYRVYYGTASGDYEPAEGDRASNYSLDSGITWISTEGAPPPISVPSEIREIQIKGLTATKPYFFVVTAVDTRTLESDYSNQITNDPELRVVVTGVKNTE